MTTIYRTAFIGDSATISIPLVHPGTGAAFVPGADYALIFTGKISALDEDSAAIIQKSSGAGITVATSTASVAIVPADTVDLSSKTLVFDVQAQHVTTGAVLTVAFGNLRLERDVTRETTTSIPVITTEEPTPFSNIATTTHAAASKATPVDADEIPLSDSAASWGLKKLSWANLKATLVTYFSTLYAALVHTHVSADVTNASTGGNGAADAGKVVKFGDNGEVMRLTMTGASGDEVVAGSINTSAATGFSGGSINTSGTATLPDFPFTPGKAGGNINTTAGGSFTTGTGNLTGPNTSGTLALTTDITGGGLAGSFTSVAFGTGLDPELVKEVTGSLSLKLFGFSNRYFTFGYYGSFDKPGATLSSGGFFGWTSNTDSSAVTPDTCLARASAGLVEINNGTAGTLRDLSLRNLTASGTVTTGTGSVTAPAIRLDAASPSRGFYSPASGIITYAANNVTQMQFEPNAFVLRSDASIVWTNGETYGGTGDTAMTRSSAGVVGVQSITASGTLSVTGDVLLAKTIAGTTGAQTINKTSGQVIMAGGSADLVVTNSLCTANSIIHLTFATNDGTAGGLRAVAGAGSFTIYFRDAPTSDTRVNFLLTN